MDLTKILLFALLIFASSSCSLKSGGDNTYTEDTIPIIEIVEVVPTDVEDFEEDTVASYTPDPTNYFSKDYQTYNLRGKVKNVYSRRIRSSDDDAEEFLLDYEFGKDGSQIIDQFEDLESDVVILVDVIRNPEGFLLEIVSHEGIDFMTKFYYTEEEWVCGRTIGAESSTTQMFTSYNEYGDPLKSKLYGDCYGHPDFGCNPWGKIEYEYLSRDDKGNWTARSVHMIDYEDPSTSFYKEERKIEYY